MYFDLFSRRWLRIPDGVPSGGGQAPQSETPPAAGQAPAATEAKDQGSDAPKTYSEKDVSDLRNEAAKYRTQLRETQDALKQLKAEAGGNKDLADKVAALEAQVAEKAAAADKAGKEAQLVRLAAKAGIDPDVAALLDLSKIDLGDEKKALETLAKLAPAKGGQPRPGGGQGSGDEDLRTWYKQARGRPGSMFGG
jgi:hypothetical protein